MVAILKAILLVGIFYYATAKAVYIRIIKLSSKVQHGQRRMQKTDKNSKTIADNSEEQIKGNGNPQDAVGMKDSKSLKNRLTKKENLENPIVKIRKIARALATFASFTYSDGMLVGGDATFSTNGETSFSTNLYTSTVTVTGTNFEYPTSIALTFNVAVPTNTYVV